MTDVDPLRSPRSPRSPRSLPRASQAWLGRQAVSFLRSWPNGTAEGAGGAAPPFMLKVSFHRPHSPYDPPQRLLDKIDAAALPPMARCLGASADATRAPPRAGEGAHAGTGGDWCLRYRGPGPGGAADATDQTGCGDSADAWCGEMPRDATALARRAYLASVAFVDEQVGAIYAALQERGLLQRSLIIWTSDHGDGQGDHFHWRKGFPYEFSAHVPMLLRWPEAWERLPANGGGGGGGGAGRRVALRRGSVIRAPLVAEMRDVFHTLVDAAGAASNASLVPPRGPPQPLAPWSTFDAADGKSLLCLLADPSGAVCDYAPKPGPWRRWIDMEHDIVYNATNHWSALTDGRVKYIFRAYWGDEQLFNLTADPAERRDLSRVESYGPTLALWRQRMVDQFEAEGRGASWVKDGQLQRRTEGQMYSPNFAFLVLLAPSMLKSRPSRRYRRMIFSRLAAALEAHSSDEMPLPQLHCCCVGPEPASGSIEPSHRRLETGGCGAWSPWPLEPAASLSVDTRQLNVGSIIAEQLSVRLPERPCPDTPSEKSPLVLVASSTPLRYARLMVSGNHRSPRGGLAPGSCIVPT